MSGQAEWDGSGTSVGDQGSGALAVSIATVALEPHRLRLRCARVSRKASGSSVGRSVSGVMDVLRTKEQIIDEDR